MQSQNLSEPSHETVLHFLDENPLLAGLSDAAITYLAAKSKSSSYRKNELVFSEGDFGNEMYFILKGSVQVICHYKQTNQTQLSTLTVGSFFGEMCMLETLPRSASIVTCEPCQLISISSLALLKLYETSPQQYGLIILNIARDLSRRIRSLNTRIIEQEISLRETGMTG
jgi:CRP-like cAMP-binding protein